MQEDEHRFITIFCIKCGYTRRVKLSCGKRTCPVCRSKWFGQHYNKLLDVISTWARPRFLTLTCRNIHDGQFTRESVQQIRDDFTELRKRMKRWIRGGYYVVQATNKGKGWHLHLHILYDGYNLREAYISKLWCQITHGSYIVKLTTAKTPRKAIAYLLSDFNGKPRIRPEDYDTYNGVFAGSRMVQAFGSCRNKSLAPEHGRCPECHEEHSLIILHSDILDGPGHYHGNEADEASP